MNIIKYLNKIKNILIEFKVRIKYLDKADESTSSNDIHIDISEFKKSERLTGIQRVVKELSLNILKYSKHEIYFIKFSKIGSYCQTDIFGLEQANKKKGACYFKNGDIYFGLDFCPYDVPSAKYSFLKMKKCGVTIIFMVYDMIPYNYPHFFEDELVSQFNIWLNYIIQFADIILCTSPYVESELKKYMQIKNIKNPIAFHQISLGSDFNGCVQLAIDNMGKLEEINFKNKTFLVVGTIEPRKNHELIINAFEKAWNEGFNFNLIIVGRIGWKAEGIKSEIVNHKSYCQRLYWFDNSSDEELAFLYQNSTALINASLAEGFGLPIAEALQFKLPVIAMNNIVFKQLFEDNITYFNDINELLLILVNFCKNEYSMRSKYKHITWKQSAESLMNLFDEFI